MSGDYRSKMQVARLDAIVGILLSCVVGDEGNSLALPEFGAWIPHVNGVINLAICILIFVGWRAIRRGDRRLHPKMMVTACGLGLLFLAGYIAQAIIVGHKGFPGDDWVKHLFHWILLTHTVLAVAVVPVIAVTVYLAARGREQRHRALAKIAFPIWAYVALTGLIIYVMNNFVRPV